MVVNWWYCLREVMLLLVRHLRLLFLLQLHDPRLLVLLPFSRLWLIEQFPVCVYRVLWRSCHRSGYRTYGCSY